MYIHLLYFFDSILLYYNFYGVILRKPFLFYLKLNNLFKKINSVYIKIFDCEFTYVFPICNVLLEYCVCTIYSDKDNLQK